MADDSSDEEINLSSIMYKEKETKPDKKDKVKPEKKHDVVDFEKVVKSGKKGKDKPNEDDVKRKRALILHLGMYLNQFPSELKTFKKVNLEKKSVSELEDLLKEFHVVMDSKNDLKTETQAALSLLQAYEYIMIEYAGVQCQGLTVGMAQDEDSLKQLKLVILKYSPLCTIEPEARLLMKVLMNTMHLHTINTYNQQLTQQASNNNEQLNKINVEYNDI